MKSTDAALRRVKTRRDTDILIYKDQSYPKAKRS